MKRYIRKEREPNLTHYTNTNTKHLQNHTQHERQDPVHIRWHTQFTDILTYGIVHRAIAHSPHETNMVKIMVA